MLQSEGTIYQKKIMIRSLAGLMVLRRFYFFEVKDYKNFSSRVMLMLFRHFVSGYSY